MNIKRANSVVLLFSSSLTNLSTATAVKFMVKTNATDLDADAKISKTLGSGIEIDTPSLGNIKVTLTSANTTLPAGQYFVALQIEYGSGIYEVDIRESVDEVVTTNCLNIIQDIIR